MARVKGVSDAEAGMVTKAVYLAAKRMLGTVPEPLRIMARSTAIMFASGGFEMAARRAGSLDPRLKDLATLKASTLIGCVF